MHTQVSPTGQERHFGAEEIIVSKTDAKGLIRYANNVFCRIAGYPPAGLIGQPHNIIRHPDMPRGVFKLMWETIGSGQEIFAYVNNLARDGANYWVLGHITPSFDANGANIGYHSNRRSPDPAAVAQVVPVYQRMAAEEKKHGRAIDAAAASADLLVGELTELGVSYEEFIWGIITGQSKRGPSWAA